MQKCGKIEEQIELLKRKLRLIYQGEAFHGRPTKTARSHGKKFQVSVKQETSRLLVSKISIILITNSINNSLLVLSFYIMIITISNFFTQFE